MEFKMKPGMDCEHGIPLGEHIASGSFLNTRLSDQVERGDQFVVTVDEEIWMTSTGWDKARKFYTLRELANVMVTREQLDAMTRVVGCKDCAKWGSTLDDEDLKNAIENGADLVCDLCMSDGFSGGGYCPHGVRRTDAAKKRCENGIKITGNPYDGIAKIIDKWCQKNKYGSMIVTISADGNEFTTLLEISDDGCSFVWLHDWWEGESNVYLLGFCPLGDLGFYDFPNGMATED